MSTPSDDFPHALILRRPPRWRRVVLLVVVLLAGAGTGWLAFSAALERYQLTPRQAAIRVLEKAGLQDEAWLAWLRPGPRHAALDLDGRRVPARPRLLLPELRGWPGDGIPDLFEERAEGYRRLGIDAPSACEGGGLPGRAACWVTTSSDEAAREGIARARELRLETPTASGEYGNGWMLALAYDLLALHPAMTAADHAAIEALLLKALRDTLTVLDGPAAALWHGRTNLAASAWLMAAALPGDDPESVELLVRAQGHFLEMLRALAMTEAWPEGYNYWIQSRGYLVALAGSAYLNALEGAREAERVREVLRRIGYWTIHATRPDHRIEGYGDEGSRVDLREETQRVIDLIASATGDELIAAYSAYLEGFPGARGYFRGYRWSYPLLHDPELRLPGPVADLTLFENVLPRSALFGRGGTNMAYLRSGWGAGDTFISFRASQIFSHHGPYDAGHFTLFKGAPLAVNGSAHAGFNSEHRLFYGIRSVAKNTLLVLRPGEEVSHRAFGDRNVADGGQRVVFPSGNPIHGLDFWVENLDRGLRLRATHLRHFEASVPGLAFLEADLTPAYNTPRHDEGGRGGKVERVVRQLVYLEAEDRLLVRDEVRAVDPAYVKKWLLHTAERPQVEDLRVLRGGHDDGILESDAARALVAHGEGRLVVDRLLPADGVLRLVGGPDHRYYVEVDSDDRVLSGENMAGGASNRPWTDPSEWRIELQPGAPRQDDHFLVVLTPSLGQYRLERPELAPTEGTPASYAVRTGDSTTVFVGAGTDSGGNAAAPEGALDLEIAPARSRLHLVGLPAYARFSVTLPEARIEATATGAGVALVELSDITHPVPARIEWR